MNEMQIADMNSSYIKQLCLCTSKYITIGIRALQEIIEM